MPVAPSSPATRDPYGAFRIPSYRRYAIGYFISVIGRSATGVAIGYELFLRTRSATALGLVGLVGALPVILLALPAGHLADRGNRKAILMLAQLGMTAGSFILYLLSRYQEQIPALPFLQSAADFLSAAAGIFGEKQRVAFDPAVPLMFAALALNSCSRAFGWAARGAFLANMIPREHLTNAVTWNSSLFQVSSMIGPAVAGGIIAHLGLHAAYALDVICGLGFFLCLAGVRHVRDAPIADLHAPDFLSGLRFVWRTKAILGTITLDLFAMLVGGATALLPIFAEEILHVGAVGLGWLRAAPSFGALAMALVLAHVTMKRAGHVLLWSVFGFGIATIVFGLSTNFVLSFLILAMTGALDNVSAVVRHTLVQLLTPDSMRGRVSAVNNVFVNSSNELGQLESGLTAALFGAVTSVVAGGIGVVLVVGFVAWKLPEVRRIGALHDLKPD